MALRGSLSDFGLLEGLQLLAQGKKTGILEVAERGLLSRLWLSNGELVRIARRNEAPDEGVLRALVAAELLSETQLAAARAAPLAPGELAIETLVRTGTIDPEAAERLAQLVSKEILMGLLVPEEGEYVFEPLMQPPVPLHAPLRLEPVMLSALEDLELLKTLRRRIPSPKRVYRAQGSLETYLAASAVIDTELHKKKALYDNPSASEDGTLAGPLERANDARGVGHIERLVFSLLDAKRDVGQIIGRVQQGELPVLRALCWLDDQGLIALEKSGPHTQELGRSAARPSKRALMAELSALAQASLWLLVAGAMFFGRQVGHDAARLVVRGQATESLAWSGMRSEVMREGVDAWCRSAPYQNPWRTCPRLCQEAGGSLPTRPLE